MPILFRAAMTGDFLDERGESAYGDIGLGVWHGLLIVGSSAAVSAKIAVSVGALAEPVLQAPNVGAAEGVPPGPKVRADQQQRAPRAHKRLGPLTPLE